MRVFAFWAILSLGLVAMFWNMPPNGPLQVPRGIAYQILTVWGVVLVIIAALRLADRS